MNTKSIIIAQARRHKDSDDMVLRNLRLVTKEADRYSLNDEEFADYYQVGVIGLMRAVETYDHSKDVKMSTWATMYIKGEIRQEQRKMRGPVSTPLKAYVAREMASSAGDEPLEYLIDDECLKKLELELEVAWMIKKCSQLPSYQQVVAENLLGGLEPAEVAVKIGKTHSNVITARSHAISSLYSVVE